MAEPKTGRAAVAGEGGASTPHGAATPGERAAVAAGQEGVREDGSRVLTVVGGRVIRGDARGGRRSSGGDRTEGAGARGGPEPGGQWAEVALRWEESGQPARGVAYVRGAVSVETLRLLESDLAAQPGTMVASGGGLDGELSTARAAAGGEPGGEGPGGMGPGRTTRAR